MLLFKPENIKKTIILLVMAVLCIMGSFLIGISDNIPMIVMLLAGIVILFFALLHPWKKASRFVILTGVCFVILALDFIFPFVNEGIAMTTGLVCFAGIIAGIIGIFTRIKSWRRLPYAASLLSLIALTVFITLLRIPLGELIGPAYIWLLAGVQVFMMLLLFVIGLINKREKLITKAMLIAVAIVIIALSIWGFYVSTWEYGKEAHSGVFVVLMARFYASIEIIIAALSLYACK